MAPAEAAAEAAEEPEAPATEEAPKAPPEVRVELDDGNWVRMSTALTGRDMLTIYELADIRKEDRAALLAAYPKVLGMIERHALAHSFDKADILDQDPVLLTVIYNRWRALRRDQAVPKSPENRSQRRSRGKR